MLIVVQENIKDVITHIMLNYEDRIKELSEIRFCSQCFKGFIRRYEMNIHPPPLEVEEKPPPQYVFPPLSALTSLIKQFSSQPMEMRRVDVDEESYFNGDDEDDEDDGVTPGPHPAPASPLPTLLSPPLSRFQFGQKRRRQRTPGVPLRTGLAGVTPRAPAPATPIHSTCTPPIGALVEYGDDDEPVLRSRRRAPRVPRIQDANLCSGSCQHLHLNNIHTVVLSNLPHRHRHRRCRCRQWQRRICAVTPGEAQTSRRR